MRRAALLFALTACAVVAGPAPSAFAGCGNPNPATSANFAAALAQPSCTTITLGPNTYTGPFTVNRNVTITGAGPGATVLNRITAGDLFTMTGGAAVTVNLSGVTLTGATSGSAIESATSLALDDVAVESNLTTDGATGNGAGLSWTTAAPGTLTVTDSAFRGNISLGSQGGGAIFIGSNGTSFFNRVLFDGNESRGTTFATGGGAVAAFTNGNTSFTNTTFSGNKSFGNGGALSVNGISALNNVTMVNNAADSNGDNVGDGGGFVSQGVSTLIANSVIANNRDKAVANDCSEFTISSDVTRLGYELIETPGNCDFGDSVTPPFVDTAVGYLTGVDPVVGALLPNGTIPLLAGSPALEAGNPNPPGAGGVLCDPVDQVGTARGTATTGRCDLGAAEVVNQLPAPPAPPAAAPAKKKCKKGFRLKRIKGKLKCKRKKKKRTS